MTAKDWSRGWQSPVQGKPLLTALIFVSIGVLPLYLTSAQVVLLENDLSFDAGRLGLATGLYFGLAAAMAQPVARTIARLGARRGLQIGATFSLVGSIAAASATRWPSLLLAVALAGLANAFMQVSTNVVLATGEVFHRQGLSFGAKQGAIPLASALSGALLPSLGIAVGWRWPYVVAAVLACGAIIVAPLVDEGPENVARSSRTDRPPLSRSLKWLAAGGACGGAAGNGISLFVVVAAVDIGTSEANAGTILAVGSALVFLLRIGVGSVADRFESTGHREMLIILLFGSAACFGLAFVESPSAFVFMMPLAMMGAWGWPGLVYFTVVRIHPEATARASGVLLASNLTGTLIGPSVVGQLAHRGAFGAAWLFVSTLAFVAALFIGVSWFVFKADSDGPRVKSRTELGPGVRSPLDICIARRWP